MSEPVEGLRRLPSVDRLLREASVEALAAIYSRAMVVQTLRNCLEAARDRIRNGGTVPDTQTLIADLEQKLTASLRPSLSPVINATGVIIHTNLGRAPLSEDAIRAVLQVASGYSNLEYRLEAGLRGSRHDHVAEPLRRITGAEDAIAVNNNASAVLLVLSALAHGKEVIVSRGQAVEIGGGFRIPDVLLESGARLIEVGTTNRTYLEDYERAITPDTGLLLHVHPSNFRVEGFVHSATIEELAELGRQRGIPVVDDLGSGSLLDTSFFGLQHEPMVQERVAAGVDLVCFSGDKLLGGPQAGLIAGRSALVAALRRHPLARAIRIDKMTIAALAATLGHYVAGNALDRVPVWRMIRMTSAEIEARAARMTRRLRASGLAATLTDGVSTVGGGSLPGETLPTRLIAMACATEGSGLAELATRLRRMDPPLVARIERDQLLIDLRTVDPRSDSVVADLLIAAGQQPK